MIKKLILIGLITLLLVSSVTAITQTQLEAQSDNDLRTFLISNAKEIPTYYDKPSNNYIFSYKLKTLVKEVNEYNFRYKTIEAKLNRNLWKKCRKVWNYNQCYNALVNEGTLDYGIKAKLKRELQRELFTLIKWRDNPTIDETIANIGGLI